jgi:hypothetical protein
VTLFGCAIPKFPGHRAWGNRSQLTFSPPPYHEAMSTSAFSGQPFANRSAKSGLVMYGRPNAICHIRQKTEFADWGSAKYGEY